MEEHRRDRLVPRRVFLSRLTKHALGAALLMCAVLSFGMAGYHWFEGLSWLDSFVNAAMILGGMGPVDELHTVAGKLFAGSYALFAGIFFLVAVGVAFAPVVHRAMRRFHIGDDTSP